jgi:hypothetical protein
VSVWLPIGRDLLTIKEKLDGAYINICDMPYVIENQEDLLEKYQLLGQVQHYVHAIVLDGAVGDIDRVSTLIHEIIEVINKRYEIGLSHETITILENQLFSVLFRNVDLFLMLLNAFKTGEVTIVYTPSKAFEAVKVALENYVKEQAKEKGNENV